MLGLKQPASQQCHQAVEGFPPHVVQIQPVRFDRFVLPESATLAMFVDVKYSPLLHHRNFRASYLGERGLGNGERVWSDDSQLSYALTEFVNLFVNPLGCILFYRIII